MTRRAVVATVVASSFVLVWGCSTTEVRLGVQPPDPPPSFVDPDAGDAFDGAAKVRSYCPSDRCPPGHTTCPDSLFLCDVDLRTDIDNCGECGNTCPRRGSNGEEYSCQDGRCVLVCDIREGLDCDGIPDNGCEAKPNTNENCGTCGLQCPADKPCINRGLTDYGCGCRPGQIYCPGGILPCVDPTADDSHCNGCGNVCPPTIEGQTLPDNNYAGCWDSACGAIKCEKNWSDCDNSSVNGSETDLVDDHNCGGCGVKCSDGMKCRLDYYMNPQCACPDGQTFCQAFCLTPDKCIGFCANLESDRNNCGTCGASCDYNVPNAYNMCDYGNCAAKCLNGWADCNGNEFDGCETDISADPKNCGGCGIVCDGIAGQACVDGQCMVEPCDVIQDAGGPTR